MFILREARWGLGGGTRAARLSFGVAGARPLGQRRGVVTEDVLYDGVQLGVSLVPVILFDLIIV